MIGDDRWCVYDVHYVPAFNIVQLGSACLGFARSFGSWVSRFKCSECCRIPCIWADRIDKNFPQYIKITLNNGSINDIGIIPSAIDISQALLPYRKVCEWSDIQHRRYYWCQNVPINPKPWNYLTLQNRGLLVLRRSSDIFGPKWTKHAAHRTVGDILRLFWAQPGQWITSCSPQSETNLQSTKSVWQRHPFEDLLPIIVMIECQALKTAWQVHSF